MNPNWYPAFVFATVFDFVLTIFLSLQQSLKARIKVHAAAFSADASSFNSHGVFCATYPASFVPPTSPESVVAACGLESFIEMVTEQIWGVLLRLFPPPSPLLAALLSFFDDLHSSFCCFFSFSSAFLGLQFLQPLFFCARKLERMHPCKNSMFLMIWWGVRLKNF